MGHNGVMEMMAQQLGLAMIPRWPRRVSGLISGTTSGTCGSRRKAEELSMTVAPARTASGAKRFEVPDPARSEEHTSELQSQSNLVCRLLLEKKKKKNTTTQHIVETT